MALFKSMAKTANMVGTMFPGTIVPIPLDISTFLPIIPESWLHLPKMDHSRSEEIRYALAHQMAKRLRQEEDWVSTARWLLDRALESGFDLSGLREDSPEIWSHDLMESLRFHVDFEDYWPDGAVDEGTGDTAKSLFWHLMPYPTGVRLPASLVGNAKEIGKSFSLTPEGRVTIAGAQEGFMRACFAVDADRDGTGTIHAP
jgi:hypothetical protein